MPSRPIFLAAALLVPLASFNSLQAASLDPFAPPIGGVTTPARSPNGCVYAATPAITITGSATESQMLGMPQAVFTYGATFNGTTVVPSYTRVQTGTFSYRVTYTATVNAVSSGPNVFRFYQNRRSRSLSVPPVDTYTSSSGSCMFTFTQLVPLTLTVGPGGTVTGQNNTAGHPSYPGGSSPALVSGDSYTLTATPAAGYTFAGWDLFDGAKHKTSTALTFSFTMQRGLSLTVNFGRPFSAATYAGFVGDALGDNPVFAEDIGQLKVTVSSKGVASGSILFGAAKWTLVPAGFDLQKNLISTATPPSASAGLPPKTVTLILSDDGTFLGGTIGSATAFAEQENSSALQSLATTGQPLTFCFRGKDVGGNPIGGWGYGLIAFKKNSCQSLVISGALPDGTLFTASPLVCYASDDPSLVDVPIWYYKNGETLAGFIRIDPGLSHDYYRYTSADGTFHQSSDVSFGSISQNASTPLLWMKNGNTPNPYPGGLAAQDIEVWGGGITTNSPDTYYSLQNQILTASIPGYSDPLSTLTIAPPSVQTNRFLTITSDNQLIQGTYDQFSGLISLTNRFSVAQPWKAGHVLVGAAVFDPAAGKVRGFGYGKNPSGTSAGPFLWPSN